MATERVQSCFEAAWEASLLLTERLILGSALTLPWTQFPSHSQEGMLGWNARMSVFSNPAINILTPDSLVPSQSSSGKSLLGTSCFPFSSTWESWL